MGVNLKESLNKMDKQTFLDSFWSVRTRNCFRNAKIYSFEELDMRSDEELLCIKNFGRKCLEEVKRVKEENKDILIKNRFTADEKGKLTIEIPILDMSKQPPSLVEDLLPITVEFGKDALFSIMVNGLNLRYKWQVKNTEQENSIFVDIPNETKNFLLVSSASYEHRTLEYRCFIENNFGNVVSKIADLEVLPPKILGQFSEKELKSAMSSYLSPASTSYDEEFRKKLEEVTGPIRTRDPGGRKDAVLEFIRRNKKLPTPWSTRYYLDKDPEFKKQVDDLCKELGI
jgi:hypothetical protein